MTTSDFIDRAKLGAAALEQWPDDEPSVEMAREIFMAGVDAAIALLDAETFTERKHEWRSEGGVTRLVAVERQTASTPWLPSEGGEKP